MKQHCFKQCCFEHCQHQYPLTQTQTRQEVLGTQCYCVPKRWWVVQSASCAGFHWNTLANLTHNATPSNKSYSWQQWQLTSIGVSPALACTVSPAIPWATVSIDCAARQGEKEGDWLLRCSNACAILFTHISRVSHCTATAWARPDLLRSLPLNCSVTIPTHYWRRWSW